MDGVLVISISMEVTHRRQPHNTCDLQGAQVLGPQSFQISLGVCVNVDFVRQTGNLPSIYSIDSWPKEMCSYLLSFLWQYWALNLGFTFARQAIYHLSHTPTP
jgi:hypothetical protein